MKVRVFCLAKDLDAEWEDLVRVSAEIGIVFKKSPLASLSPEEAERIRLQYRTKYPRANLSPVSSQPPPSVQAPVIVPGPRFRLVRPTRRDETAPSATSPVSPRRTVKPPIPWDPRSVVTPQLDLSSHCPLSVHKALTISQDLLYMQVSELGSIVESLLRHVLEASNLSITEEPKFHEMIDQAIDNGLLSFVTQSDLHIARICRNQITHRKDGTFPKLDEMRLSRASFLLAILNLLPSCGDTLRGKVLAGMHPSLEASSSNTSLAADA